MDKRLKLIKNINDCLICVSGNKKDFKNEEDFKRVVDDCMNDYDSKLWGYVIMAITDTDKEYEAWT